MEGVIHFKTATMKLGFTVHRGLSYEYLHIVLEFTFLGFQNVSAVLTVCTKTHKGFKIKHMQITPKVILLAS